MSENLGLCYCHSFLGVPLVIPGGHDDCPHRDQKEMESRELQRGQHGVAVCGAEGDRPTRLEQPDDSGVDRGGCVWNIPRGGPEAKEET